MNIGGRGQRGCSCWGRAFPPSWWRCRALPLRVNVWPAAGKGARPLVLHLRCQLCLLHYWLGAQIMKKAGTISLICFSRTGKQYQQQTHCKRGRNLYKIRIKMNVAENAQVPFFQPFPVTCVPHKKLILLPPQQLLRRDCPPRST